MLRKGRALLSLGVMGLAAWGIVQSLRWPLTAALFPLVISVPLFLLAAVELGLALFGGEAPADDSAVDLVLSEDVEPRLARQRTLVTFAWIAAFFALIVLAGFLVAIPAFVLLYLRLQAKESWRLSVALAAVAWGFIYGVFVRLLHIPFLEGWLPTWAQQVLPMG